MSKTVTFLAAVIHDEITASTITGSFDGDLGEGPSGSSAVWSLDGSSNRTVSVVSDESSSSAPFSERSNELDTDTKQKMMEDVKALMQDTVGEEKIDKLSKRIEELSRDFSPDKLQNLVKSILRQSDQKICRFLSENTAVLTRLKQIMSKEQVSVEKKRDYLTDLLNRIEKYTNVDWGRIFEAIDSIMKNFDTKSMHTIIMQIINYPSCDWASILETAKLVLDQMEDNKGDEPCEEKLTVVEGLKTLSLKKNRVTPLKAIALALKEMTGNRYKLEVLEHILEQPNLEWGKMFEYMDVLLKEEKLLGENPEEGTVRPELLKLMFKYPVAEWKPILEEGKPILANMKHGEAQAHMIRMIEKDFSLDWSTGFQSVKALLRQGDVFESETNEYIIGKLVSLVTHVPDKNWERLLKTAKPIFEFMKGEILAQAILIGIMEEKPNLSWKQAFERGKEILKKKSELTNIDSKTIQRSGALRNLSILNANSLKDLIVEIARDPDYRHESFLES